MKQTPVGAMRLVELEAGQQLLPSAALSELKRLAQVLTVCGPVEGSVAVVRDRNRIFLRGSVAVSVETPCHLCLKPVREKLESELNTELVSEAELARRETRGELDEAIDVHIVRDGVLDLTVLIEDELLLAARGRPCQDEACPNRPTLRYGEAVGEPASGQFGEPVGTANPTLAPDRRRPFEGLRAMMEAESGPAREQIEHKADQLGPLEKNIKHSNE